MWPVMESHENAIHELIKNNKGFVTAAQVTDAGIPRRYLSEMVESGIIYKVERGIYALPETWEDELFFLQYRFSKGVFSHETALYLHGMTDRTPIRYTMTFPFGYNTVAVRKQGIIAKVSDSYELGITEVLSPCQNALKVYDIERTLCDIIKSRHKGDIQVINQAMKTYAASKNKDVAKLISYAEKLRVKPKILNYMEVLL
jgi:predicted transcriptional regulator of viral defense system